MKYIGGKFDGQEFPDNAPIQNPYLYSPHLHAAIHESLTHTNAIQLLVDRYQASKSNNHTVKTLSGRELNFLSPEPDQFTFNDIAHGLAWECRHARQISKWYSVAEHSCWCHQIACDDDLDTEVKMATLLHDAHEAFMGDVIKPLKLLIPQYDVIADRLQTAIGKKFGVDFNKCHDAVKKIDLEMMAHEKRCHRTYLGNPSIDREGESERRTHLFKLEYRRMETAEAVFRDVCRMYRDINRID